MEKSYIPLRPIGVTQGVQLDAAYILMLEHKADHRIVPVLITKADSEQIYAALTHHDYSPAALFRSLTTTFDMTIERIVLDLPFRGHTTARLWVNQQGDLRIVPTSVSMAVCISLLMHVGLYVRAVDYDVLTHQGRQEGRDSHSREDQCLRLDPSAGTGHDIDEDHGTETGEECKDRRHQKGRYERYGEQHPYGGTQGCPG